MHKRILFFVFLIIYSKIMFLEYIDMPKVMGGQYVKVMVGGTTISSCQGNVQTYTGCALIFNEPVSTQARLLMARHHELSEFKQGMIVNAR